MHPKSWTDFWNTDFMSRKRKINTKYSPDFKISVIMDMREHKLGYNETIRKYWNDGLVSNHFQQIKLWERIYIEEGAEGLMKERRGRACSTSGTRKGRPPKLDKKVEEDLIAENQRLRMEIEYLKKLSALVLAEERENGKKQK